MEQRVFDGGVDAVEVVARVRALVAAEVAALGAHDLVDDAVLVASELATNAVLHGDGIVAVHVRATEVGVRVEVHDRNRTPPMLAFPTNGAMTGRGIRLVDSLARRWNAEPLGEGKVVWAELERGHVPAATSAEDLLDLWDEDAWEQVDDEGHAAAPERFTIELGDVPIELLLAAKTHVDNLVREFTLAEAGAGSGRTAPLPANLADLLHSVVTRFAEARQAIRLQAVVAATQGLQRVRLELSLPASAADAGEEYLQALDEADAYCRAARLLTLETPPQHRVFRHWYVTELVKQLRAASSGRPRPPVESFTDRLLREVDESARARRESDRAARMYQVASALAEAPTLEAAATAVLEEGVAVLAASGAGLLVAQPDGTLLVGGAVGYSDAVVSRLHLEPIMAELPAATALRTGEPVWLESRDERDERFPQLTQLEADTVSICAVPLCVGDRSIGAIRFSFADAHLFDHDERRFVLALAAQAAQALDRAQLDDRRRHLLEQIQRTLLPRSLPGIEGFDVGVEHHPGGDDAASGFYDLWRVAEGHWAFAVGDAAVGGAEGAGLSAMVRFGLRALAAPGSGPGAVLRELGGALARAAVDDDAGAGYRVVLGFVDVDHPGRIQLASCGQPPPIARLGGGDPEVVPLGGSPLDGTGTGDIGEVALDLRPGDLLTLYSHGGAASEAETLRRAFASLDHGSDVHRLAASVADTVAPPREHAKDDDVTVVVVRARNA